MIPPMTQPLPAADVAALTPRQRAAVISVIRAMVEPEEPKTAAQATSKYRQQLRQAHDTGAG